MANKLLLIAGALPFNTCSMAGPTSLLSDLPGWFPSEGHMGQPPRLGLEWTGQMWGCGSGHLAPGAAGEPQVALGRSLPIPGPQLSHGGLRAGREWPAKGSGCDFERTFPKLVKWKEAAGTTAEAAGFINWEPNQSGRNRCLHQSRVQLRNREVVPPAMTLSESLYKWTTGSKWPQRSFGEVPVGKITRVLPQP